MKKKTKIRMRIFIPVLILVVLFPILTWIIFSAASDRYVRYSADGELKRLMGQIRLTSETIGTQMGDLDEQGYSKELLRQVKDLVKQGRIPSGLLVLNSKEKLIYPKEEEASPQIQALYQVCREQMRAGTLVSGKDGAALQSGKEYTVGIYEVPSEGNIRAKYMIGYVPVPDTGLLLSYTRGLLLAITALLCGLSLLAVWLTAGSIAKPLRTLCRQTEKIGDGRFDPVEEEFSICEVEELKRSFNRMAVRLDQMEKTQNQFFQNVSHDLRTPLMSICGYAQGIQCGVMEDPVGAAGIILSESMRLKELVDSILTISRLDNQNARPDPVEICLNDFLAELLERTEGAALERGIGLEYSNGGADGETDPAVAMVMADPQLLTQAVQNVLSNCIRYAETTVSVNLSRHGCQAVITVEDDGPGIAPQDLPHVFERFYHGKDGGFGIGLAMADSAVRYMGGEIGVGNRPAPGHGAVFCLQLPERAQCKL